MKLEGAVAVVLGGARGIGKAYCTSLLDRKAKVVCTDILDEVGKQTEAELQQKYGSDHVVYRTCNGASEEQIKETLNFAKAHFGKLDIVANNVGILDETHWQRTIDLNLGTTVRVTNAVLELIGKDKGGSGGVLVHTASNGGLIPAFYCPVYCATKAAMIAYVRSWSHKLNYDQHGVRMFTVCPRSTATQFVQDNLDPTKVIKLDVLLKLADGNDASIMLKPEWVGEAMVNAIEDDTANGVAVQLLGREHEYHFKGPNEEVVIAKPLK